jgi:hypothetical protein
MMIVARRSTRVSHMCRSCASSACDTHTHAHTHRSNGICHLSARPVQRAVLQAVRRRVAPMGFVNAAPRCAARRGSEVYKPQHGAALQRAL